MKAQTVPSCRIECRTRELMSAVRAEIAYQRIVPPAARATRMPAPLLGSNAYEAAAASLPFTPAN